MVETIDWIIRIVGIISTIFVVIIMPLTVYIWNGLSKRVMKIEEWKEHLEEGGGPVMGMKCKYEMEGADDKFSMRVTALFASHEKWLEEKFKRIISDVKLYINENTKEKGNGGI